MGFIQDIERRLGKLASEIYTGARNAAPILAKYQAEPAAANKACRDLNETEAFDLVMYLIIQGELKLTGPARFNSRGDLIYPSPKGRLLLVPWASEVEFYRASMSANEKNGSLAGNVAAKQFEPTPGFAVFLYRFAKFLKEDWRTTKVVWGGIGHGDPNKPPTNCHEKGTCFDFYGAYTGKGDFDVAFDWALQPVARPNSKDASRWKSTETNTWYRLTAVNDDPAYSFFKAVYGFATKECRDATASPTTIGNRSYIVHPDHPDPALRSTHQEHMHMQIGDT